MYENFIQRQVRRCLRVLELEDRCQQTKDFEQNFWDEIYMCHGVRIVFFILASANQLSRNPDIF